MNDRNQSRWGRRDNDRGYQNREDRGMRSNRREQGGFQGQDEFEDRGNYDNDLDYNASSRSGGSQSQQMQRSRGSGRGQGINDFEQMDRNRNIGYRGPGRFRDDRDYYDRNHENERFSGTGSDRSMGYYGRDQADYGGSQGWRGDDRSTGGSMRKGMREMSERGDHVYGDRSSGRSNRRDQMSNEDSRSEGGRFSGRTWDQDETSYQGRVSQYQNYSSYSDQDDNENDFSGDYGTGSSRRSSQQRRDPRDQGSRSSRSGRGSSRF